MITPHIIMGLTFLHCIVYALAGIRATTRKAEGVIHKQDQFWETWE